MDYVAHAGKTCRWLPAGVVSRHVLPGIDADATTRAEGAGMCSAYEKCIQWTSCGVRSGARANLCH